MEFAHNNDIVVEGVAVSIDLEATNVEPVQNIRKVAILDRVLINVYDIDTIYSLAERENIKQYTLAENNAQHVKPAYLGMRKMMCDYTGSMDNLCEVHIPYQRLCGIICGKEHLVDAIRDCVSYCEKNCIFPMGNLTQFIEERGFKFFNVQRTSGAIDGNWQIDKGDDLATTIMPDNQEGGCGIYLAINVDTPEYLHKGVSINRLCRMNGISEEVKEEILVYLKQQLHDHYKVHYMMSNDVK